MTETGPSSSSIAVAALLVAAAVIASAAVLTRLALEAGATAEAMVLARLTLPVIAVGLLSAARRRTFRLPRISKPDSATASTWGVLWTLIVVLEVLALERLPAAMVVILISLVPAWVLVISRLVWKARITRRQAVAALLALSGTALLVGFPSEALDPLGVALAVVEGVLGAALFLLMDRGSESMPVDLLVLRGTAVSACFAIAAVAVALGLGRAAGFEQIGSDPAAAILAAGLFATYLLFLGIGIRASSAFAAGVAVAVEPVFAVVLGWALLSEALTAPQLMGGVLVVGGVVTTFSRRLGAGAAIPRENPHP